MPSVKICSGCHTCKYCVLDMPYTMRIHTCHNFSWLPPQNLHLLSEPGRDLGGLQCLSPRQGLGRLRCRDSWMGTSRETQVVGRSEKASKLLTCCFQIVCPKSNSQELRCIRSTSIFLFQEAFIIIHLTSLRGSNGSIRSFRQGAIKTQLCKGMENQPSHFPNRILPQ